jgi:hypothetical protein
MNLTRERLIQGVTNAAAFCAGEATRAVSAILGHDDHSAPGEPPFMQSGNLSENIRVERAVSDGNIVRGRFGVRDNIPYARRLELGYYGVDSLGRNYSQAPRPFLRPALLRNREHIKELIAKG